MEDIDINKYAILLVDDDIEYAETTKTVLELQGFSIHVENNPIRALEYIKNNKVDIILCQMKMVKSL